jgi:hypothetical protein
MPDGSGVEDLASAQGRTQARRCVACPLCGDGHQAAADGLRKLGNQPVMRRGGVRR